MRMSVYGRLGAGFQFGKVWAMIRHDFSGLLRILGMAIVLAVVIGIVVSILIFVLVLIGLFIGFAMTGGNLNIQSSHPGAAVWAIVFATGGIILVFAVLCGILSTGMYVFVEMMIVRALGYWTRQFDVPAWRGQDDPMPFELAGAAGYPPVQQPPHVPPTGQPPAQG